MTRTLKIAKDNFKNNDSDTFKHKQRLVAIKKTFLATVAIFMRPDPSWFY